MGGNSSTPSSPPPPVRKEPTCLEQPWRKLPEKDQDSLDFIRSYKPHDEYVKHLRILLHGPVGAGKSSFINSVESAILGRICGRALTDANSGVSFTRKYKTFKISKDESPGTHCDFVFNDIMGLEKEKSGIPVEDIKLALRGRVKEGYEFIPNRPLMEEDAGYNTSPSLDDKIHVLVCVVPADSVARMSDEVVKMMRDVRMEASRLDIPQLAIITKVDEACPEARKDVKNVYKSKALKMMVEQFHQMLGIPVNCIFLMKNYSSEVETSTEMNVQILHPLKQIITFGKDFLNNQ